MKKFAYVSDLTFFFSVSFLCSACAFRLLRLPFWQSVALSTLCAVLTTLSAAAFLRNKYQRTLLKKSDERQKERLLFHLALQGDEQNRHFFSDFFTATAPKNTPIQIECPDGATAIEAATERAAAHTTEQAAVRHKDGTFTCNGVRQLCLFRLTPLTADDLLPLLRIQAETPKRLLCAELDEKSQALCKRYNIEIWTGERVYTELKSARPLPPLPDETPTKKARKKLWFAKSNAKRFLTSAALLLLAAQLTPFFLYYLLFAFALLCAAVFTRIFGYE